MLTLALVVQCVKTVTFTVYFTNLNQMFELGLILSDLLRWVMQGENALENRWLVVMQEQMMDLVTAYRPIQL